MDFDLIQRLERKIDQLLERNIQLEEENQCLQASNRELTAAREWFRADLDRILAKLGCLDQERT